MINKKYLILLAVSGLVIALDQVTKMYVHTHFDLGESITVVQDFFNFTYVRNTGAAFGIFSTSHITFREIFFLSVPPIAAIIIFMLLKSTPTKDKAQILALSAIFGGAMGNYIDRLRFRYVIDFLDFHIKGIYTWPAFNIADSAIVCGVTYLFILMLVQIKHERLEKKNSKA